MQNWLEMNNIPTKVAVGLLDLGVPSMDDAKLMKKVLTKEYNSLVAESLPLDGKNLWKAVDTLV
jgi:hypothetical protein